MLFQANQCKSRIAKNISTKTGWHLRPFTGATLLNKPLVSDGEGQVTNLEVDDGGGDNDEGGDDDDGGDYDDGGDDDDVCWTEKSARGSKRLCFDDQINYLNGN